MRRTFFAHSLFCNILPLIAFKTFSLPNRIVSVKSALNILKSPVESAKFLYKKILHSLVPEEIIRKVADYGAVAE